jgi:hypothetical protein
MHKIYKSAVCWKSFLFFPIWCFLLLGRHHLTGDEPKQGTVVLRGGCHTTTAYEVLIVLVLWIHDIIVISNSLAIWCVVALIGEDRHLIELEMHRCIGIIGCVCATATVNQVLKRHLELKHVQRVLMVQDVRT